MDPVKHITSTASRMVYQVAYAAALLMPGSKTQKEARAVAFAAKAEENAQKHAPAGIAVAVNLLVLGYLGSVKIREEFVKDNDAIEVTMDTEGFFAKTVVITPPSGGGGGSSAPAVMPLPTMPSAPITPDLTSVLTTITPSQNQAIATAAAAQAAAQSNNQGGGQGTGQGSGIGSGTGPGTGSGTGGGNGSGGGTGNGPGRHTSNGNYKVPVVLVYTAIDSIAWNNSNISEPISTGNQRAEKILKEVTDTFNVVATEAVRNNNLTGNRYSGYGEGWMPFYTELDGSVPINGHVVLTTCKNHPEAAAVIFIGGWEDVEGGPAMNTGAELGRQLSGMGKRLYLMTFSKSKGFITKNGWIPATQIAGGGWKNSAKELDYELRKFYVPPPPQPL